MEKEINEGIFKSAPDWRLVLNWDEQWRGEPGIPNETLYMFYTDDPDRYNKEKMPTSIVVKDKQLATTIFGFTPKYVDFDVQCKIANIGDGKTLFKPIYQVAY